MRKLLIASTLLLAACGGNRMAQPISMVQPTDVNLDCDTIYAEMLQNQNEIQERYAEIDRAQSDRTTNMLWGGLIGYATSEDGSAARAEIGSIQSRNTHLMVLMQKKGCWSGGQAPTT